MCFANYVQINLFGQCMTSPYTRACRQTNFSEGGFVRKVPFSFFIFLHFFLFSLLPFFKFLANCPFIFFIKWVLGQLGFYLTTQWKGDGVLGYLIAGSIQCKNYQLKYLFGVVWIALRPKNTKRM